MNPEELAELLVFGAERSVQEHRREEQIARVLDVVECVAGGVYGCPDAEDGYDFLLELAESLEAKVVRL